MLKEDRLAPQPAPTAAQTPFSDEHDGAAERVVKAHYPNHVWHVDLTAVSTVGGFWVPWLPFALPQVWPFAWWVAVVLDHFSRRVMGFRIFRKQPTADEIRAFLSRTIRKAGATPKYVICDKGPQFWPARRSPESRHRRDRRGEGGRGSFKRWCRRHGIRPRFGAVGKHGSIALIERFIRSMKEEGLRRILLPLGRRGFRRELDLYMTWYNGRRPHTALGGATPDERYFGRRPANRTPRWEPREKWPRGSPCAKPQTLIKGTPGVRLELAVTFKDDRRHLPIVRLRRVA